MHAVMPHVTDHRCNQCDVSGCSL